MDLYQRSEADVISTLSTFVTDMENEGYDVEGGFEFWDDDGGWNTDFDNQTVEKYTTRNWRTGEEEERSYTRYATLDRRHVPGLGYAKAVEQFGGEGQGDQYYIIVRVDPEDTEEDRVYADSRFFKIDGYYASHYGRDLDGPMYEVFARQKTITVFDRKGKR